MFQRVPPAASIIAKRQKLARGVSGLIVAALISGVAACGPNTNRAAKKALTPDTAVKTSARPNVSSVSYTPNLSKCAAGKDALGVSRVITLDGDDGFHYGGGGGYRSTRLLLKPKEVVLTFDDGPNPRATGAILKTLDDFCVKATFFVVGKQAKAYPKLLKRVERAGHTIAGHTRSHPMPFTRQGHAAAVRQIEQGFADVQDALGEPAASLFRFPGLDDNKKLLAYLRKRGVISLAIDVDSGDTRRGATVKKVVSSTISGIERRRGGVVLFHDPLKRTAKALPTILRTLKKKGYRIVHLKTSAPYRAKPLTTAAAGAPRSSAIR